MSISDRDGLDNLVLGQAILAALATPTALLNSTKWRLSRTHQSGFDTHHFTLELLQDSECPANVLGKGIARETELICICKLVRLSLGLEREDGSKWRKCLDSRPASLW